VNNFGSELYFIRIGLHPAQNILLLLKISFVTAHVIQLILIFFYRSFNYSHRSNNNIPYFNSPYSTFFINGNFFCSTILLPLILRYSCRQDCQTTVKRHKCYFIRINQVHHFIVTKLLIRV